MKLLPILLLWISCSPSQKVKGHANQKAPYLLLISIDGYRHDYTDKYKPPFLTKFRNSGSSVEKLIPVFPSVTFTNHYSLITGLRAENHGIVNNHFYSKKLKLIYTYKNQDRVRDDRFYKGVPFWNLAKDNGVITASEFWIGSEAQINGKHPDYFSYYEHHRSHDKRIQNIINYLKLPEKKRPHFLTLYFSDVDSAGHRYGPEANETKQALYKVDRSIEKLYQEIQKLKIKVNIIITSDHGMTQVRHDKVENIDEYLENFQSLKNKFTFLSGGGFNLHISQTTNRNLKDIQKLKSILKRNAKHFFVYEPHEIPRKFQNNDEDLGDLMLITKTGVPIGTTKTLKYRKGSHGLLAKEYPDMKTILYAKGPQFHSNIRLKNIENIHLYPFMAKLFNFPINHKIDGKFEPMKAILK